MAKKNEKIPYQEYQAKKIKEAKMLFKVRPYPWPVLASLLVPFIIFILMLLYYMTTVRTFPE